MGKKEVSINKMDHRLAVHNTVFEIQAYLSEGQSKRVIAFALEMLGKKFGAEAVEEVRHILKGVL